MSENKSGLKSAYDLAMERMAQKDGGGLVKLSPEQKTRIAEVTRKTRAKVAEIEIMYQKRIAEAQAAGGDDAPEKVRKLEDEQRRDLEKLRAQEEDEKNRIRK